MKTNKIKKPTKKLPMQGGVEKALCSIAAQ